MILLKVLLGVPLELVHRWWRIALIYLTGVVAGSLTVAIADPHTFIAGASGGVYALITAHLGTVIMNYRYLLINYSNKYIKIFDKKLFFFL